MIVCGCCPYSGSLQVCIQGRCWCAGCGVGVGVGAGVGGQGGDDAGGGVGDGGPDGDLAGVLPVEALDVEGGVQGLADHVWGFCKEAGGVGKFVQEGGVVDGRGGAGGEGVQLGLDGGVLVAVGELLADPVAHGAGGGALVIAELLGLGHEPLLRGLDQGEFLAERFGPPVAAAGFLGLSGRELDLEHGGPVVAEQVVIHEPAERGGDDLLFDAGPGVLGVGLGMAGVGRVVRAQVVDVFLAGRGAAGAGDAVHPALAFLAADPGAQRVDGAAGAGRGLVLGVADVAPLGADGLGLLPQVHADKFGVAVGLVCPGPVGAGDQPVSCPRPSPGWEMTVTESKPTVRGASRTLPGRLIRAPSLERADALSGSPCGSHAPSLSDEQPSREALVSKMGDPDEPGWCACGHARHALAVHAPKGIGTTKASKWRHIDRPAVRLILDSDVRKTYMSSAT